MPSYLFFHGVAGPGKVAGDLGSLILSDIQVGYESWKADAAQLIFQPAGQHAFEPFSGTLRADHTRREPQRDGDALPPSTFEGESTPVWIARRSLPSNAQEIPPLAILMGYSADCR